jgi:hypothetical protein
MQVSELVAALHLFITVLPTLHRRWALYQRAIATAEVIVI